MNTITDYKIIGKSIDSKNIIVEIPKKYLYFFSSLENTEKKIDFKKELRNKMINFVSKNRIIPKSYIFNRNEANER